MTNMKAPQLTDTQERLIRELLRMYVKDEPGYRDILHKLSQSRSNFERTLAAHLAWLVPAEAEIDLEIEKVRTQFAFEWHSGILDSNPSKLTYSELTRRKHLTPCAPKSIREALNMCEEPKIGTRQLILWITAWVSENPRILDIQDYRPFFEDSPSWLRLAALEAYVVARYSDLIIHNAQSFFNAVEELIELASVFGDRPTLAGVPSVNTFFTDEEILTIDRFILHKLAQHNGALGPFRLVDDGDYRWTEPLTVLARLAPNLAGQIDGRLWNKAALKDSRYLDGWVRGLASHVRPTGFATDARKVQQLRKLGPNTAEFFMAFALDVCWQNATVEDDPIVHLRDMDSAGLNSGKSKWKELFGLVPPFHNEVNAAEAFRQKHRPKK